jgi:hypothetical protein
MRCFLWVRKDKYLDSALFAKMLGLSTDYPNYPNYPSGLSKLSRLSRLSRLSKTSLQQHTNHTTYLVSREIQTTSSNPNIDPPPFTTQPSRPLLLPYQYHLIPLLTMRLPVAEQALRRRTIHLCGGNDSDSSDYDNSDDDDDDDDDSDNEEQPRPSMVRLQKCRGRAGTAQSQPRQNGMSRKRTTTSVPPPSSTTTIQKYNEANILTGAWG